MCLLFSKWTAASEEEKVELSTCTSQCTKQVHLYTFSTSHTIRCLLLFCLQLPCGHRCPLGCHHGNCPPPETCQRKVTLRCSCRRLKKVHIFMCTVRTFDNHVTLQKVVFYLTPLVSTLSSLPTGGKVQ